MPSTTNKKRKSSPVAQVTTEDASDMIIDMSGCLRKCCVNLDELPAVLKKRKGLKLLNKIHKNLDNAVKMKNKLMKFARDNANQS